MNYTQLVRARHLEILAQMEAKARGEDPRAVIPIGLRDFDRRAGIKRRQLTLFGAATGEGKSLWASHLMTAAAQRGYRVEVHSFEDPAERTVDRSFSSITNVNNARMMALELTDRDLTSIALAVDEIAEWAGNIEFHQGLRETSEVLESITSKVDGEAPDLVIVDYLQALAEDDGETLERTLAKVCWRLNQWAQQQGAAVVAFSQLNNKPAERGLRMLERAWARDPEAPPYVEGYRPHGPSDLNWCSAAGHRAKDVGFLFRPARYLKEHGHRAEDNVMEISFPKSNFGSEGLIRVGLDLKTARFYDLAKKDDE